MTCPIQRQKMIILRTRLVFFTKSKLQIDINLSVYASCQLKMPIKFQLYVAKVAPVES